MDSEFESLKLPVIMDAIDDASWDLYIISPEESRLISELISCPITRWWPLSGRRPQDVGRYQLCSLIPIVRSSSQ